VHLGVGARHVCLGQRPLLRVIVQGEDLPATLHLGLQVIGNYITCVARGEITDSYSQAFS